MCSSLLQFLLIVSKKLKMLSHLFLPPHFFVKRGKRSWIWWLQVFKVTSYELLFTGNTGQWPQHSERGSGLKARGCVRVTSASPNKTWVVPPADSQWLETWWFITTPESSHCSEHKYHYFVMCLQNWILQSSALFYWEWLHTPAIPATLRMRQEDCKFKANLSKCERACIKNKRLGGRGQRYNVLYPYKGYSWEKKRERD